MFVMHLVILLFNVSLCASMQQKLESLIAYLPCNESGWELRSINDIRADGKTVKQYWFESVKEVTPFEDGVKWSWESFIAPHSKSDACSIYLKRFNEDVVRVIVETNKKEGNYLFISDVNVDKAYRRKGYAKQALTIALGWFDACGIEEIRLRSYGYCHELYKKVGFQIVGKIKAEYSPKEFVDMIRTKISNDC